jgi:hypothetical protein
MYIETGPFVRVTMSVSEALEAIQKLTECVARVQKYGPDYVYHRHAILYQDGKPYPHQIAFCVEKDEKE